MTNSFQLLKEVGTEESSWRERSSKGKGREMRGSGFNQSFKNLSCLATLKSCDTKKQSVSE